MDNSEVNFKKNVKELLENIGYSKKQKKCEDEKWEFKGSIKSRSAEQDFINFFKHGINCKSEGYFDIFIYKNHKKNKYRKRKRRFAMKILNIIKPNYRYCDLEMVENHIEETIVHNLIWNCDINIKDSNKIESFFKNLKDKELINLPTKISNNIMAKAKKDLEEKCLFLMPIDYSVNESFIIENISENVLAVGIVNYDGMIELKNGNKLKLLDYFYKEDRERAIHKLDNLIIQERDTNANHYVFVVLKGENEIIAEEQFKMLLTVINSLNGYEKSKQLEFSEQYRVNYSSNIYSLRNTKCRNYYLNRIERNSYDNYIKNVDIEEIKNWYHSFSFLNEEYKERIIKSTYLLNTACNQIKNCRYDDVCKSSDALFGSPTGYVERPLKVGERIKSNSKNINTKYRKEPLQDVKIDKFWDLRNKIAHGSIKNIMDSPIYMNYEINYNGCIENDYVDFMFDVIKYIPDYFNGGFFLEVL